MLNNIFPCVSGAIFSMGFSLVLLPILLCVKTMKEAKWVSYFALISTYITGVIAVFVCVYFYADASEYEMINNNGTEIKHELFNSASSIALGFSTFTFAFGRFVYLSYI